jgi:hypothetical protein
MDIQDHNGLPESMRLHHKPGPRSQKLPQGFDAMCIERALEGVELTLAPERLVIPWEGAKLRTNYGP